MLTRIELGPPALETQSLCPGKIPFEKQKFQVVIKSSLLIFFFYDSRCYLRFLNFIWDFFPPKPRWQLFSSMFPSRKFNMLSFFFPFIFISWRLITLQCCSGFCHTLTWIIHGCTCVPHPDPPSHLPLHPIPLGLPAWALVSCIQPGLVICFTLENIW